MDVVLGLECRCSRGVPRRGSNKQDMLSGKDNAGPYRWRLPCLEDDTLLLLLDDRRL